MSNVKRDALLNDETVRRQIAERAYFLSESIGFAPGRETEFWLTAEEEVISSLISANGAAPAEKTAPKAAAKAPAKPAAPRKAGAKKTAA